jgi:hypothetical protein
LICPVCKEYYEENHFNPDCVERRAIREVMSTKMVTVTSTKLDKQKLLEALKDCLRYADAEQAHSDADELLLRFINDNEITEAFEKIPKYYA